MRRFLLDTSVFVALESGRPIGDAPDGDACISVVTLTELSIGVRRATPADRDQRSHTLQSARRFIALPYDEAVSEHMASLIAEARHAGRRITQNDAIIAATALAHDCTVLTQDADFDVLAEIEPALRIERV